MKDNKLLSMMWVVIPTYNRAEDLIACIRSLIEAKISIQQIIVVDNNSQDETVYKIQKKYPEIVLIALDQNLGATGASNIGFDHALEHGAAYILRLDSDTIVAPDFAMPLLATLSQHEDIGIVAPKIYYFEPPDEIWYAGADAHPFHFGTRHGHRHEKDSLENSQTREVDYAWGAAMLIRGDVLEKTGGFDTDFFVYYEEVDFCLRIKNFGYHVIFEPESHVWHKVGSTANNPWTAYHWNRSKILLYRKHAKNLFHYTGLLLYAFLYASFSSITNRNKNNRGPIIKALGGLWDGLFNTTIRFE